MTRRLALTVAVLLFAVPSWAANSVTQYGITVTFSPDAIVGQYVCGDYYVVGPVSVTEITVADGARAAGSVPGLDGAMVNVSAGTTHGFDGRVGGYKASLNKTASYPFPLIAGDRLVCAESHPIPSKPTTTKTLYLKTAIVLTCVAERPETGTFRPAYAGPNDRKHRWSDIDKSEKLPLSLAPPRSTPSLAGVEEYMERTHLDIINGWSGYHLIPEANSEFYGREISTRFGTASLMLLLDERIVGNKDELIKRYVQTGIDIYGLVRSGKDYLPSTGGGWFQGRKAPVVIAGHLLGDEEMMRVGALGNWQEDGQTFFVSQADLDRKLLVELTGTAQAISSSSITLESSVRNSNQYSLRGLTIDVTDGGGRQSAVIGSYNRATRVASGIRWPDHTPARTATYSIRGYEATELGQAEWGIQHVGGPSKDNPSPWAAYRGLNAPYWFGAGLTACALGLRDEWAHEPFFAYLDRIGPSKAAPTFHRDMAKTYWENYERMSPPASGSRSIPREMSQ